MRHPDPRGAQESTVEVGGGRARVAASKVAQEVSLSPIARSERGAPGTPGKW